MRACSSAGQSAPLIRVKSAVQIRPGPPTESAPSPLEAGAVAQLGEHLPCKQEVRSSILLGSTNRRRIHMQASPLMRRLHVGCQPISSLTIRSMKPSISLGASLRGWRRRGVLTQEQRKVRLKRCSLRRPRRARWQATKAVHREVIPATSFTAVASACATRGLGYMVK